MLSFRDSCLWEMLNYPRKCYRQGWYPFALQLPFIFFVLTVGVVIAVFFDFLAFATRP